MEVALSPILPQELNAVTTDVSPMIINTTPTTEQDGKEDFDSEQQYEKPPPLHTVADWKIVLHLPEIETWLRMTSERVRDLTYSVQQDLDSKHVDVHLVQLKDICEDISDHVEQIHALLETEFSLKLLSYSVNVIVDIHTVQFLWHQLRVSVLVLRERILQGLQDANGNYTRQTDILQAFTEETKEDRLDSLTEVDDSGQLTIKCSQNYLSLDCGITAFELSDYSPSEDLLGALGDMTSGPAKITSFESWSCSEMDKAFPELTRNVGLLAAATDSGASKCIESINTKEIHLPLSIDQLQGEGQSCKESSTISAELSLTRLFEHLPFCKVASEDSAVSFGHKKVVETIKQEPNPVPASGAKADHHPHSENSTPKRSIQDGCDYNEDSPTQPTLPKRGLFLKEDIFKTDIVVDDIKNRFSLIKTEISKSTPSLLEPPDRSKLCLALQTAYNNCPSAISQSCDCLHNISELKFAIQNHFREKSMALGKSSDSARRQKLKCKKSHDIPEEVASCRISEMVSNTAPTNQMNKRGVLALQNGISSGSMQSIEGTESDTTSTSSEPYKQEERNGQSGSEREPSGSPTHSQVSSFSAGSDPAISPFPLLQRNKSEKTHSSSANNASTEGKIGDAWYGSDEYLALPSHLKQTEVLALKLENLTKLLPQKSPGETIQNIDDWELSEMNSDSEPYPNYQVKKKHKRLGRISPSSSSDIISSVGDSIESGPLSDILSDEELCTSSSSMKRYLEDTPRKPSICQASDKNEMTFTKKSALIQQLMEDIQHQENNEIVWKKMEGFVSKLDEFIQWLNEAMETTENWSPPKAETDSLKLYLETHLSFKLNVDSHCALKEAVTEEGCQLLDLIVSHKSGLKDMLQMIASQWKELQKQIKRQHSWILRALRIIKAEILATDVSAMDEEGTESPKAEVQLCFLEAQRDAVEQMSLKLYSEQYNSSSNRKEEFADMSKVHTVGSNGLLDFDSEYQELWDWLIDMESIVIDSHDLMMSEEQQLHLYKRYSVEMSIRHPKKMELLSKVEALKRSGVLLPSDLLEKVDSINEKWELLGKTLQEKIEDSLVGHSGLGSRDLLSPESGSLVRQLEVRIKELKGWLRDTELFIFNSCLRQENEGTMNAEKQLQYFKSLCCEIKQRRRGVGSVLRLCQHLLDDQDTCSLNADHQSMQLIIVNLERRWEAIIMQAVQWQTRLQKKLAKHPDSLNVIDPGLMELNSTSEDALEWDEMDISNKLISINEEFTEPELKQDDTKLNSPPKISDNGNPKEEGAPSIHGDNLSDPRMTSSSGPKVYQVYSLHDVELSRKNHIPLMKNTSKGSSLTPSTIANKDINKDSSLSSTNFLPELMGSTTLAKPQNYMYHSGNITRHSESQNKVISETKPKAISNFEIQLFPDTGGIQDKFMTNISDSDLGNIVDVIKQNFKQKDEESLDNFTTSEPKFSNKTKDVVNGTHHDSVNAEELQGKHNAFTFYDYSYLQGLKLKLPQMIKQPQSEKTHKQGNLLHGFYFDKIPFISGNQPGELKSCTEKLALPTDWNDANPKHTEFVEDLKKQCDTTNGKAFSNLSHSSSLDSLCLTSELLSLTVFKSGDGLNRSTSLESLVNPYKSNEDLFSHNGSGDLSGSSDSVGELSKRTLDLLNRLENIQSPLDQKINRSISDITLQSTSQRMSLTGQVSLDIASSINEDSPASLTELSSSDDLSLCSEDIIMPRNKVLDSNASFRKHLSQSVADESDINVSMIVNVSCTSACTDDEDDSDLLSSSTLTLTEEELGMKDDDDDSSIATDEDIYEDGNLISGLDYIKNELHTWIRPKLSLTKEKRRNHVDDNIWGYKELRDDETLKPKDSMNIEQFLSDSICKLPHNNGNSKNVLENRMSETKRQAQNEGFQLLQDRLVDDMENGNVAITQESLNGQCISTSALTVSMLDGKESENKDCICESFTDTSKDSHINSKEAVQLPNITSPQKEYQNHIQYAGQCIKNLLTEFDLDIKEDSKPSTALLTLPPSYQQSKTGISEHVSDCCACLKSNETEKNTSGSSHNSCCNCESFAFDKRNGEDCSVHNFVMEIIDMASTALKNKSQPESEPAVPHSLAQIKEKVLEHSHRPIQLRKGDFYSYLSLSSHDSDCGEVTKYVEEKSSTPVPLDFAENIECFFEACPEEERVEQQMHIAPNEAEVPLVKYKDLDLIDETQTSNNCNEFSFLSKEMGTNPPDTFSKTVSENIKNYLDESFNQEISNKGPVLNSFPNDSIENHPRQSFGTAKSEDSVTSPKTLVKATQLKPDHSKGKEFMHPIPKTLVCEEKLLPLYKERHINTKR
ncbi:A-kinase anchor protein 6 isoform X2 [Crotalus tigris]|uniref:A-kinase anchor protein 6 isoform X2 n=1 Tax=Crotalus tigris TaxID=88082 RepID=UPI00192F79E8|nr:A-kinase anchor protein 6 isoform X2 [Crotalus tigris]